jgi:predicted PurR-regulated permease PerM
MTKQLVIIGTAVMTTLLALVVVWQFRIVLVYVLISLALAATMRPLVNRLVSRGFMRRVFWIFLYIVVLSSFGFLILLTGQAVISEIQQVFHTVSIHGEWRLPIWLQDSWFQRVLVTTLPPMSKLFEAVTGDKGQLVLPALLGFTRNIGSIVSGVLVVLFLSIYWSMSQSHFERLWLSLLPSEQRKHARNIWRTIEPDLGAYIRSEVVQSILAAMLLGVGYWLLGSPYPALLALVGALAWLIPVVGVALAIILPLLMGLLSSIQISLFTVLYTLIVLFALQVWVEPRLFKRTWDNPILTLVILLAMADAFGLVGILIAPPLSAVCQILLNLLISSRSNAEVVIQVSDLKDRQANLFALIEEMDSLPPPLVASSMERLTDLLSKAEPILQATLPNEQPDLFHPSQPIANEGERPYP